MAHRRALLFFSRLPCSAAAPSSSSLAFVSGSAGVVAAAAACITGAAVAWNQERNPTNLEAKPNQQAPPPDISTYSPIWPLRIIRPNPNLEICFDTRTRNAVYAQHRIVLTDDSIDVRHKKERLRFKEETVAVEEKYRSRISHYHLSGYDRGHLAPAADFDDRVVVTKDKTRSSDLQDSYNLCNVSPQNSDMNRKVWAWLEDFVRQVARSAWKEQRAVTYVTTGPLWLPKAQVGEKVFSYSMVGIGKPPSLVMVPTHFFKVIVVVNERDQTIVQFACFVVPNDASANEQTMQDYVVPWTDLETVTGLVLYPGLADDSFKVRADAATARIQSLRRQEKGRSSANQNQAPLLLSDGSSKGQPSRSSMRHARELYHLCTDQACIPRKQR